MEGIDTYLQLCLFERSLQEVQEQDFMAVSTGGVHGRSHLRPHFHHVSAGVISCRIPDIHLRLGYLSAPGHGCL